MHPGMEVELCYKDQSEVSIVSYYVIWTNQRSVLGVEVDVGGVPERVELLLQRGVDPGVAVTHGHRHDPGEHVEVLPPLLIVQVLHLARVDQQGLPAHRMYTDYN